MSYRSEGLIHRAHLNITEVYVDLDEAIARWIEDNGEISTDALQELAEVQLRAEVLSTTLEALLEDVINQLETNQTTIH